MSQPEIPTGGCSDCGSHWSWSGNQWIVADAHGRGSLRHGTVVDGQPEPLNRCPECGVKLVETEQPADPRRVVPAANQRVQKL
ncbi:MAG: hypothetical protein H0U60_20220 [Blastocatellia bacterium]|nr:hypothetical protein [Blastocatellia bacterium]